MTIPLKSKKFLEKVMTVLRIKSFIGGLEISDSALRFGTWDGQSWRLAGLRLTTGIVEGGKVKDYNQFAGALRQLHNQITGDPKNSKIINVVVSLSSVNIYTQIFTLPFIEGENLEKAVRLNIQMVSPAEASQTYSGWQMVNEDQDKLRLEILSAFANKNVVDEISRALRESGFLSVSVESRALSLARLIREAGVNFDPKKTYLVLDVDQNGIDFLIMRQGQLYFEYPTSFRDAQREDEEQFGLDKFSTVLVRNLHQVMNFYNSHWTDPLTDILVSTPGLSTEIAFIIKNNFSLEAKDLLLNLSQPPAPSWFVALGSGFRGRIPHHKDREISLLGVDAQEEFHMQQTMTFLDLWKLATPLALGILLAAFIAADFFLIKVASSLKLQVGSIANSEEIKNASALGKDAENFNRSVQLIASVKKIERPLSDIFSKIYELAKGSSVSINRLVFQSYSSALSLSGESSSQGGVSEFKNKMEADPLFASIDLPLSEIKTTPQKTSFSMSFSISPQAVSKTE